MLLSEQQLAQMRVQFDANPYAPGSKRMAGKLFEHIGSQAADLAACQQQLPRWVPVSSGKLPPDKESVPVLVAIPGDDREGPHNVLTGDKWDGIVGEWADWGDAVSHWLTEMPALPKEASDAAE